MTMSQGDKDLALRTAAGMSAALAGAVASSHGQGDLAVLIGFAGVIAPEMAAPLRDMGKRRVQRLVSWFFAGAENAAQKPLGQAVLTEDAAEALYEAYRRMANTSEP